MNKGIVVLHRDFGEHWIEPVVKNRIGRIGLHVNPFEASTEEFLTAVDAERGTIDALERLGVEVEYYLHAVGFLLPRELIRGDASAFRQNELGERTADCNCCPSSEKALGIISENAARLARRLKQKSHRYHVWQDDDLGGDVSCKCGKCRNLTSFEQNGIIADAILRGIRTVDANAEISLLVYGEEPCAATVLRDGQFIEYAPFRRMHGIPITQGEVNNRFMRRLENLIEAFGRDRVEVLEYFLSYDYADFCKDGERVRQDLEYYRAVGIERLSTFAVFPEKDFVKAHGFYGVEKYFDL